MREYREFETMRRNTLDIFPEEDDPNRIKINSPLGPMLSFRYMNKVDSCNVPHFQLRHLLCCPTVRSVIFPRKLKILKKIIKFGIRFYEDKMLESDFKSIRGHFKYR